MRYGLIGEDPTSPLEKLEKYTGEIDWTYLAPHYRRGSLLWVDPSLSLVEVGGALARDDAGQIESWRRGGDLVRPSEPHARHWEETQTRFLALVVSPFVLVQPLPSP